MARPETISSPKNPLLKEVRKAQARASLTAAGLCLAEGWHLLDEALRSGLEIPAVLCAESALGPAESRLSRLRETRLLVLPEAQFAELSTTEATQGVLSLVAPPVWTLDQVLRPTALAVVLDGVQDPGNLGAIARAAEAFGATGLLLVKGTVSAWNPKALRASAGSLFRLPFVDALEPQAVLAALEGRHIAPLRTAPRGGHSLLSADLRPPTALLIGSEGRGLSPALSACGVPLHIPVHAVESLNAAVATSVILYEAWRQRSAAQ